MKIDFARPDREHERLKDAIEGAALRVLRSGRAILGDEVTRFEQSFARFVGRSAAVGISSGSDALLVALQAIGVTEGDEVLLGAFGFVAAPEAVVRLGAIPVFVDIEPRTLGVACEDIARKRSAATRAVISVDLFGMVHDMERIRAAAPGVGIVEDAAQALGSTWQKRQAGSLGDVGTFSFFPSKALGAAGDGGACVTHDDECAARMRRIRAHGAGNTYAWEIRGGNHRLDALQAAILDAKMTQLPSRLARRRAIGAELSRAANCGGLRPLAHAVDCDPVHAPLAFRAPESARNVIMARLRERLNR